MKIKRYKKVHKHLNFFINSYGFRQPYQILLDGTFCFAALNNKINIADNLPRYLQGELKLLTTQCAIIEMEKLGAKLGGALVILKQFVVHKCGHEKKPVAASKCLMSMVTDTNPNHYVVASQDRDLQERVRDMIGVPLLYLHGKTPVLEPPSKASVEATKANPGGLTLLERQKINKLKLESGLISEDVKPKAKKKKKGANPLSCKKKKKKDDVPGKVVKNNEVKNKRKRVRIAQHVKDVLLNRNS